MDKIPAPQVAEANPDGLPSMQFDGRRLLSDPDLRHAEDASEEGVRRLQVAEQVTAQSRLAALAGLTGLVLVAALTAAGPLALNHPPGLWWATLAALIMLGGLLDWMLVQRVTVSPFRARRWRFAMVIWGALALTMGGATFGALITLPWLPTVAMALIGVAVAVALTVACAAYWLPGLVAGWVCLVAAQWFVAGVGQASPWFDVVLGFDLVLLALGMVISVTTARASRHAISERMTRRELAQLKARVNDQTKRLSAQADERQTVEQALSEARAAADGANRAKTEFLATMSHEVRTPLNGILPILEMLRESRLDDSQREFLDTAYNSSRHLLRIINDVLDFAKAESGKLELESIEIDVRDLVESVTDLMGKSAQRRGLRLTYNVTDDVPRRVRGDSIRLRQVLSNLVGNAIKFTQEGEIRVEVHKRRASRKEVELVFAVSDTGVGMSRDTQRRLFRPFCQADASTTRKHGGTGLGLVICKRLVELMGGRIGVKSQLGQGSSFSFVLPMRRSSGEVPPARRDLVGLRVLTLVDDPVMAEKLSDVLQDWGMSEERVDSALTAVSKLKTSAQLGRSWAYEMVLVSLSASRATFMSLVDDLRDCDGLDDLAVVLVTTDSKLVGELQKQPGVCAMAAPMDFRVLQRQLHRLFDVEGNRIKNDEDTDALFDSLVLDFDAHDDGDVRHPVVRGDVVATALLVEDNPINLSVARRMLAKLGIQTEVARNGHEALGVLSDKQVDLVLMDCQMPELDGYQTTRKIREDEAQLDPPRHMPIVAMTANVMTGDREKCLSAGMDDYLGKPLEFSSLRRALEPWVRLGGARRTHGEALLYSEGRDLPALDVVATGGLEAGSPAPDAPVAPSAPIDTGKLDQLVNLMGDDLPGLIRKYLATAPRLLADLKQAAERDDLAAMVGPAHSLKSSSANMAAMRLSRHAGLLEHAARKGDVDKVHVAHRKVQEDYRAASTALAARLSG